MQSEQIIQQIPSTPQLYLNTRVSKPFPIHIFSLLLLISISCGLYEWYQYYSTQMRDRSFGDLTRYDVIDMVEYNSGYNMEEVLLKYNIYKVPLASYTEPNIVIALCIVLTFFTVIDFVQRESSTPIAFFEFNLCGIYMQILIMGLDLAHYLITSKCICLVSGAGAIWLHLLTKITYYNGHRLIMSPFQLIVIIITYIASLSMIFYKNRLDLLIGIVLALIDIFCLEGGTIKYPKQVFQEKQDWAEAIRLTRLPLWQNFIWNQYKANQTLCVDSIQFYVTRGDRQMLISKD